MNQPLARFRAGQISCAIWENEINVNGTTKTVLKGYVSYCTSLEGSQQSWA